VSGGRLVAARYAAIAIAALAVAGSVPANAAAKPSAAPQLDARAWVLVDARTGETLAARAGARPLPIASATKLMTAHLAFERLPLRKRVRMAPYSAIPAESLLGAPAGTPISVRDLLYSLILESANDSAFTLAEVIGGSQRGFAVKMNRSAAALGLVNTHYTNPIGLDSPANYSSAHDLAALARVLLRNRTFARIADSTQALLPSLRPPRTIGTRNTLLFRAPWVNGVKTGHTLGAGYVLVGSGERKGTELISVVLGAPSEYQRDSESLALLDYGFELYRSRRPVRTREVVARPSIRYAGGELPLVAAHAIPVGVRRGQRLEVSVRAPREVSGPIRRGEPLGRVLVTVDGREAGGARLLASRSIPKASALEKVRSGATSWPILLAIGLSVILVLAIVLRRRRGGLEASEEEMRNIREQRRREREQRRNHGGGPA
jgi:D-alanyl-D-alanine carboxypeptidase (penicillin-binding protein 5/6)